jgi:hypothetical protein
MKNDKRDDPVAHIKAVAYLAARRLSVSPKSNLIGAIRIAMIM